MQHEFQPQIQFRIPPINHRSSFKTQPKMFAPTVNSRKLDQRIAPKQRKQKLKKIRKILSTRKETQFPKSLVRKKNLQQIFKDVLIQPPKQPTHNTIPRPIRMCHRLVDTIYRQNIKNYNPYIATLQQLEQESDITLMERQRISNLCHIGVAKLFLKMKKFSIPHTYYRVNMLIRSYMWEEMSQLVNQQQENYDNIIFVPATEMAVSFNPRKYPAGIEEIMPKDYYSNIIVEVNRIITAEYVQYKLSSIFNFAESLTGKLILGLIGILCLIFMLNRSRFLIPIVFGLLAIWILYSIYECVMKLNQLVLSKNATETITKQINQLFERIRTDQVEWKTGQDFYWLEIHYIKKKKKNTQYS